MDRFASDLLEDAVAQAIAYVQASRSQPGTRHVLAYDGYLTLPTGERFDAIYAEGVEAETDVVMALAQRYRPEALAQEVRPDREPSSAPCSIQQARTVSVLVRTSEPADRPIVDSFLEEHATARVARLGELVDARSILRCIAEDDTGVLAGVLTYVLEGEGASPDAACRRAVARRRHGVDR